MNLRKYATIAGATIGVTAAIVAIGILYWLMSGDETQSSAELNAQFESANTIAQQWQWNNFAERKGADRQPPGKPDAKHAVPDGTLAIYKIVQSIKLDENGRVVPDETLKEALEEGFDVLGPDLSREAMSELQNSIRTGLPGPAGEETANILQNYYHFRSAEAEFNRPNDGQVSPVARHKELEQLRRNFLGEELAEKLFAVEDVQAGHMFAAIEIQRNAALTADEKQAKLAALQQQLVDRQLKAGQLQPEDAAAERVRYLREQGASDADIDASRRSILGAERARALAAADREEAQWQSSFNGFWQARRYVMQAGFDEVERERQIDHLLDQYFSPEERERARITSIDWQARDSK